MSGRNFHANRTTDNLRKSQADMRARIQTGMLVSRLQGFVNGDHDMTAAAVTAALGLLRKTLPDMTTAEVTGDAGGPIQIIFRSFGDEEYTDPAV